MNEAQKDRLIKKSEALARTAKALAEREAEIELVRIKLNDERKKVDPLLSSYIDTRAKLDEVMNDAETFKLEKQQAHDVVASVARKAVVAYYDLRTASVSIVELELKIKELSKGSVQISGQVDSEYGQLLEGLPDLAKEQHPGPREEVVITEKDLGFDTCPECGYEMYKIPVGEPVTCCNCTAELIRKEPDGEIEILQHGTPS